MRIFWATLAALVILVTGAMGEDCGFGGSLGLEFTFTPVPPAALDISTDITLSLTFGGAYLMSRTHLTWDGLEASWLTVGLHFEDLEFRSSMRFDPCFSMYRLEARGLCCPFSLGGLLILENLAPLCEPPDYTLGVALDLELSFSSGFWVRSLTGFGVWDLYYLVDDDVRTDIQAAPGWWFEEQLIGLGLYGTCFFTDTWVLFTDLGLSWWRVATSYRWTQPQVEVGARLWFLGLFAFTQADLVVAGHIEPVALESVTTFDLGGFLMQKLSIEVAFSGITIYARTHFDFSGLLQQVAGLELRF